METSRITYLTNDEYGTAANDINTVSTSVLDDMELDHATVEATDDPAIGSTFSLGRLSG